MQKVFAPLKLGAMQLEHRVVMAPLTRLRCNQENFAPGDTAVEYYSQRASPGGLLITEATPISPETPNNWAPGIYTPEQEAGWKKIVDAVHAKGGLISIQIWHTGRVAHASWGNHPYLKSLGRPLPTVSSSDVPLPETMKDVEYGTWKMVPPSKPRPLTAEEIKTRLVDDYRKAAEAAKRCGFDAVEVHAAHGYLINQFLCDGVNKRTDEFGGSIENRMRLMKLVVETVIDVMGADRTAIRISPTYKGGMTYFDCGDSNPEVLYREVLKALDKYNLAYLLLTEPRWKGEDVDPRSDEGFKLALKNSWAREVYSHPIISGGGFTPKSGKEVVEKGIYDAVAFGRWFISNPDLPERLKTGKPLNVYDRSKFYVPEPIKGFIDYPFYGQENDPKFAKYEVMEQDEIGQTLSTKA